MVRDILESTSSAMVIIEYSMLLTGYTKSGGIVKRQRSNNFYYDSHLQHMTACLCTHGIGTV